jgi:signal transduction histidine kinase
VLGGLVQAGAAAGRSQVAELGSVSAFPAFPWRQVSPAWLLVGLVAAFLSGEALQLVTGFRLGVWRELWLLGASGAAATAAAIVAAASSGRASAAWRCFAAGCALWSVGAMARALPMESWRLGPLLGGSVRSAADPLLLADLGFLGLVPFFLGAVALALPAGTTTLPRARLLIDAVVLPASLALLAYLVLGRGGAAQTPTDHHILLALVYPAAYLGVAFGAILSARRIDGEGSAARQPLLVGRLEWAALVFVPGAALLGWISLEAQPVARLLADVCFVVGFALVALEALERLGLVAPAAAAVAPRPGRASAAWGRAAEPPLPWRASSASEILARSEPAWGAARLDLAARLPALFGSAWNLSLAGGAAAAVLVIATLELVVVHDVRPAIYLGSVGLLALVVARQFITLVDNGRLIDRLRVAAELEARLREVGLAVSRSLEQAEVLALICQAGQRVFQVDTVIVWRVDARQQMLEAVAAVGEPARNFVGRKLEVSSDLPLAIRAFRTGKAERMSHVQPAVRTDGFLTAATGSQSLLAVPLVQGQRRLGVLVFGSSHPEKFARDDLIKAELLAAQAVVAMENAKLYGELARRLGEVEALYELSQATQRARTAHDIACALLEILRHRLDFVHAAVYLSEGVGRALVPIAVAEDAGPILPVDNGAWRGLSAQLVDPTLRRVAATGETFRLDGADDGDHQFLHAGMQTRLTVPLNLGDRVLGVVDLETSRAQAYAGPGGRTIVSLGHSAALAIENRRLSEETRQIETYRELDRLKSELLQTVSHELRTPLGSIKGFTTTLIEHDRRLSREEKLEFLEIIDQESDRLRGLIEDLLDMSKIEAGVLQLDHQALPVAKLVLEAIKPVAGHSPEHNFEAAVPADLFAQADPKRIRQVLHNLLENAVKYSPDGGMIRVQARREDVAIVVSVLDQGIGIPRHDLPRVFDRFHRVDSEVGRRVGGSGLGLAICRGIVEAHGGRIWAESEPGTGSVFSFTLSAAAPPTEDTTW